jgi:hypothetical protein
MITVLIIGIVVYILYSQSGSITTTPQTIDKTQPAAAVMDKVIAVESQPANKKPTVTAEQPEAVLSTPAGVDSQFSAEQHDVVNTIVQKQKYIPGVVNPDGSYLDKATGKIIYN